MNEGRSREKIFPLERCFLPRLLVPLPPTDVVAIIIRTGGLSTTPGEGIPSGSVISANACLGLDGREVGVTGAVKDFSVCVLERFRNLEPHSVPGLSGSRLGGRGKRLVLWVPEALRTSVGHPERVWDKYGLPYKRGTEGNDTRTSLGNHNHRS